MGKTTFHYHSRMPKVRSMIVAGATLGSRKAAEAWADGIREHMRASSPSGVIYPHPHGGSYRASAPGEPPAVRTGEYEKSWRVRQVRGLSMAGAIMYEVGTSLDLGKWLEKGTSRMAPRPHVREGFARNRLLIMAALRARWDRGGGMLF